MPRAAAAASVACRSALAFGLSALQRSAARVSRGTTSRKSSMRRAGASAENVEIPVRFSAGPGFSRTSSAGSSRETITIGMVFDAFRAASIAPGPTATIALTLSRTRSSACWG